MLRTTPTSPTRRLAPMAGISTYHQRPKIKFPGTKRNSKASTKENNLDRDDETRIERFLQQQIKENKNYFISMG